VAHVLPVTTNPISNSSTAQTLKITSVLVENNVDPVTGKAAEDHLEITLTNTGPTELSGFEVYTTYTDPTDKISESYYTALPATFTIAPGANRVAHFDATDGPLPGEQVQPVLDLEERSRRRGRRERERRRSTDDDLEEGRRRRGEPVRVMIRPATLRTDRGNLTVSTP